MTLSNTPEQPAPSWQPVTLRDCPAPKGAYSPGVRAGDFVFVSGQVPRDPRTGELVGDDVTTQTRQVMRNVAGVLEAAGTSLAHLVSVTVYLTSTDDWAAFDAAYREIMSPPFPTRAAVGASLRDILVEVSAVAYVGGRG